MIIPDSMGEIMETVRADHLRSIARKLGLRKLPTRKDDLIETLERHFETHLREYLSLLSPAERNLLAEAAYNRCYVDLPVFSAKYGVRCPLQNKWGGMDDNSLLRPVFTAYEDSLVISSSLADRLREVLPKPPEIEAKTVDEVPPRYDFDLPKWYDAPSERPVHVYEGEKTVFLELGRVLGLAQAGGLAVGDKGRRPTGATVKKLADCLVAPDFEVEMPEESRGRYYEEGGPVRAHAWAVLIQQCGWVRPRSGRLVLTPAGKEMLQGLAADSFAAGIEAFWSDDVFDELNRIPHIRGQSGKGKRYLTPPGERKYHISDGMKKWPVGRWMPFEEAYRLICAHDFFFLISERPYTLYFGQQRYGHLGREYDGLSRQYLRALLFESMATLGLVDVAYTYPHLLWPELHNFGGTDDLPYCGRYDGLLYVRLNNLGAYCLGRTDTYEAPDSELRGLFNVLPNLELAIMGSMAVSAADRGVLESFADQTGDQTWKISTDRLLHLVESGGKIDQIRGFLRENAANDIPDTVTRFLDDTEARLTALKSAEAAVLVEVCDEATAALIAHDAQVGKICYRAGAARLAVPQKNLRAFRTALKKMGYVLPQ